MCEGGVDLQQSPVQLQCPLTAPRGLKVSIRGEAVAVRPREDVLFVVQQEQVSITLDCPWKGSSSQVHSGEALDSLEHGQRGQPGPEGGATGSKLASWFRPALEMKHIQEQMCVSDGQQEMGSISHMYVHVSA